MSKEKCFALTFAGILFLAISSTVVSAPMSSSRADVYTSGMIIYGATGFPTIRRNLLQNWRFSADLYAAKADLWIGHWDAASNGQAIIARRSDFLSFLYANIRERFPAGTNDPPGTFDMFMQNGWLLKDAYGTYIRSTDYGSYMVDVGNPNVQKWYADWIKSYLDAYGLSGVSLDNCLPSYEILWNTAPSQPINPRTGQVWTNQEFKDAVIAFVNNVKNTIGSKFVIGNGIFKGTNFWGGRNQYYVDLLQNSKIDGIISEGWVSSRALADWFTEDTWLKSIDFAVWLDDNFLVKGGKIFITVSENAGLLDDPLPDGSYPTFLPPGATKEQYVTYVFASRLLAATHDGNYVEFGYYMPQDYPQSLFKIDLGDPLGEYYMIDGTHVYSRDFSQGKVFVNPTSDTYSVSLDGSYQTFDGFKLTSPITVAPHTGVLLKRL